MDKVDLKAEAGASVPNISIIMPTYNSEAFVGETIESVIAQTYPSWELLVVDDCSVSVDVLDEQRANTPSSITSAKSTARYFFILIFSIIF